MTLNYCPCCGHNLSAYKNSYYGQYGQPLWINPVTPTYSQEYKDYAQKIAGMYHNSGPEDNVNCDGYK